MKLHINNPLNTNHSKNFVGARVLPFEPKSRLRNKEKIGFKTTEGIHIVNFLEIIRCEAQGNYTQIHLQGGKKIMISKTLKKVEDHLRAKGFVRVHQSHLVSLTEVEFIGKSQLSLRNGEGLPISRRMKDKLLSVLSSSMPVL